LLVIFIIPSGSVLLQVTDRTVLIFWDVTMCRTINRYGVDRCNNSEDLNLQQHDSQNLTTRVDTETPGTRPDIHSSVTEHQEESLI